MIGGLVSERSDRCDNGVGLCFSEGPVVSTLRSKVGDAEGDFERTIGWLGDIASGEEV